MQPISTRSHACRGWHHQVSSSMIQGPYGKHLRRCTICIHVPFDKLASSQHHSAATGLSSLHTLDQFSDAPDCACNQVSKSALILTLYMLVAAGSMAAVKELPSPRKSVAVATPQPMAALSPVTVATPAIVHEAPPARVGAFAQVTSAHFLVLAVFPGIGCRSRCRAEMQTALFLMYCVIRCTGQLDQGTCEVSPSRGNRHLHMQMPAVVPMQPQLSICWQVLRRQACQQSDPD